LAGTLLIGLMVAGTAGAQPPPGVPGGPPRGERLLTPEDRAAMGQIFWHRVQERLGLNDQQVTDLRALLDTERSAARANVQSLIAARRQLRTLLDQQGSDPAAIQTAATHVKNLQATLFDQRLQTQLAIRTKLTAEQWQGWLALRKGLGHRGMRGGRGFGPGAL
jgi:Spy/CpxP family protein refolding chaperone